MLNAYNNDIEYKGRMYHIQTEDNGVKIGSVTTTVFHSGQTLDCKSSSYRDAIANVTDLDEINKIVKQHMMDLFSVFYKRLFDGYYDEKVAAMYAKGDVSSKSSLQVPRPSSPVVAPVSASAKPDILRASQQSPGLSSLNIKKNISKPAVIVSASSTTSVPHIASLSKPLERSNAVLMEQQKAIRKPWKGFMWPEGDLSLDVLVCTLMNGEAV